MQFEQVSGYCHLLHSVYEVLFNNNNGNKSKFHSHRLKDNMINACGNKVVGSAVSWIVQVGIYVHALVRKRKLLHRFEGCARGAARREHVMGSVS